MFVIFLRRNWLKLIELINSIGSFTKTDSFHVSIKTNVHKVANAEPAFGSILLQEYQIFLSIVLNRVFFEKSNKTTISLTCT